MTEVLQVLWFCLCKLNSPAPREVPGQARLSRRRTPLPLQMLRASPGLQPCGVPNGAS